MSTGPWSTRCWSAVAFRSSPSASAGWISNSLRPAPSARESSTSATAWRASASEGSDLDLGDDPLKLPGYPAGVATEGVNQGAVVPVDSPSGDRRLRARRIERACGDRVRRTESAACGLRGGAQDPKASAGAQGTRNVIGLPDPHSLQRSHEGGRVAVEGSRD